MNHARETPIFRVEFAADGTKLNHHSWEHRKRLLLQDLQTQLPALRQLHASKVSTAMEIFGGRAYLILILEELPQVALPNMSTRPGTPDLYLEEIQRVCEQQASLPERFQKAIRSFEHAAGDAELAQLRQLIWKSRTKGFLQMPSSLVGYPLKIPHLPHALPTTANADLEAQVLRLARVELKVLLFEDLVCPINHRLLFTQNTKIHLHRCRASSDVEETLQLAKIMHLQERIRITVEIEYAWVDGQPHRLTLSPLSRSNHWR